MASENYDLRALRRAALRYSLSRAPIFSGLPEDDLDRISGYAEIRGVRRGAYLFRQGEPVIGFYVVRLGVIHVSRIGVDGGESVIHLLHAGDSFAERAILSKEGYPADARALEESEVILIPAAEFKRHQKERPELAWRMVSSMSHHLRSLVSALEGLRINDVEKRVIYWILQRCPMVSPRKGVEILLDRNQGEMAAELATRRETLSRVFRKLQEAKYISLNRRLLKVQDVGRLREYFAQR